MKTFFYSVRIVLTWIWLYLGWAIGIILIRRVHWTCGAAILALYVIHLYDIFKIEICPECGAKKADTECAECGTSLCSKCAAEQDGLCIGCFTRMTE